MRLLALVTVATSLFSSVQAFCGANPGTKEEVDQFEKEFQAIVAGNATMAKGVDISKRDILSKRGQFTVPVYWNVLYDQSNGEGGYSCVYTLSF